MKNDMMHLYKASCNQPHSTESHTPRRKALGFQLPEAQHALEHALQIRLPHNMCELRTQVARLILSSAMTGRIFVWPRPFWPTVARANKLRKA